MKPEELDEGPPSDIDMNDDEGPPCIPDETEAPPPQKKVREVPTSKARSRRARKKQRPVFKHEENLTPKYSIPETPTFGQSPRSVPPSAISSQYADAETDQDAPPGSLSLSDAPPSLEPLSMSIPRYPMNPSAGHMGLKLPQNSTADSSWRFHSHKAHLDIDQFRPSAPRSVNLRPRGAPSHYSEPVMMLRPPGRSIAHPNGHTTQEDIQDQVMSEPTPFVNYPDVERLKELRRHYNDPRPNIQPPAKGEQFRRQSTQPRKRKHKKHHRLKAQSPLELDEKPRRKKSSRHEKRPLGGPQQRPRDTRRMKRPPGHRKPPSVHAQDDGNGDWISTQDQDGTSKRPPSDTDSPPQATTPTTVQELRSPTLPQCPGQHHNEFQQLGHGEVGLALAVT